jgi:hypothetical protein
MKKRIIVLMSLVGLLTVNAQDKVTVEKNQFKINVLLPGMVYEHGFNEKNTLYSELSFGFGFQNSGNVSVWSFYPTLNGQYRHYYNLKKRSSKGRVTSGNSGGFVAINAIYNFKSFSNNDKLIPSDPSFTIAPVWGFQRTYKHNFNIGANAGIGYSISKGDNKLVPVLNFTLGWVIGTTD